MKTAEPKNTSVASMQKSSKPFFSKQGEGSFFGESINRQSSFFNPSSALSVNGKGVLQRKLTIGEPDDKYEREADAMANRVVQRSSTMHDSETSSQVNSSTSDTPSVQSKCAACEHEEKLQEKNAESEAATESSIRRKSIFESNQPPEEESQDNNNSVEHISSQASPVDAEQKQEEREEEGEVRVGPGAMALANSYILISQVIPVFSQSFAPQIQLRANVSLAPTDLSCILMDVTGTPGSLDVFFGQDDAVLDGGDLTDIENFVGLWVGGGLSDDLIVSGYASVDGPQRHNWRLSCQRAEAVQAELLRIGVPSAKITTFAHGETNDFDPAAPEPNRRATINTTPGIGPTITPVITPADNFAGRSTTRFGLSELLSVNYTAVPGIAAAEHFGVMWNLVSGTGLLVSFPAFTPPIPNSTYIAGNIPATEQLGLTVVTGPAAGTNLVTANIPIIAPSLSYMVQVPGTGLCHTTGTASAGFRGNVFMLPTDVSFNNVQWREGTGTGIGTGSLSGLNGRVHAPTATMMTILNGNVATGCQVNTVDSVSTSTSTPNFTLFGPADWTGNFIWPIQWQYQAIGGPLVTYMTAFHLCTVDSAGTASQSKAGAGPFTRALGDPTSCIVGGLATPHCC